MNKVAIFGVNGYLGRHLAHWLGRCGICCVGFDIQDEGTVNTVEYFKCDVTDERFWDTFDASRYSSVIFLAGRSGVEASFKASRSFVGINVIGLLGLLERLKDLGKEAPNVIFPSSRLVYNGGGEVAEMSERCARSVYAATKTACEELLSAYHARYGVGYVALRICVPYGNLLSKEYSYGTIGFFMTQLKQGKPITIWGDGSIRKTYTYIKDLCRIVEKICTRPVPSGPYNVGGCDYSLKEVAEMMVSRFGGSYALVPWPEYADNVEMGNISLNSGKLDSVVGIQYEKMENHLDEL